MFSYSRSSIGSQLGCLILTAVLLALPLAGITIEPTPILTPLVMDLVPLGTSLQSVPDSQWHPTSFVAPAKFVLGPLPSAVFEAGAESNGRLHNNTIAVFPDSRPFDSPNGRSPPSN